MRNKTLTAILVASLPLFISACTLKDVPVIGALFGGKVVPQKEVTLNMWGMWESPEVLNVIISKFNEQNPKVKVAYEDRTVMGPSKHKETVRARLSDAVTPDIVLIHSSWINEFKDLLSPIPTNLMSSTDFSQKFYPVALESANIDGKIYAAPAGYDGIALVYNIAHFEEIDQVTPPTAWEEFRRLALALTLKGEDGSFVRSGAAIGTVDNIDFFPDILGLMFAQAGVSIPDNLDSKPAQDALAFYTMFSTEDKIWDNTLPEASAAFAQEKVSMIFVPSWNLLDIIKARPDLDIGVAPVPQAIPDDPVVLSSFWMYAVPKNSSNKDAAWEFISYLIQEDQQLQLFDLSSRYRPYGVPYASVSLATQVSTQTAGKYIKPILDTAPFAKMSSLVGRSGNIIYTEALKTAINSLTTGPDGSRPTFEEALTIAKETITTN